MKKLEKQGGITLIALVITIVVLLILAGVSLSLISGENGILGRATKAVDETEIASAQEEANLIYSDLLMGKYAGEATNPNLENIVKQLKEKGYKVTSLSTGGGSITEIKLDSKSISLAPGESTTVEINYKGNEAGIEYYVDINGAKHKMTLTKKGVIIEKTATNISGSGDTNTLEANSDDDNLATASVNGNTITITAGETEGMATITITYGDLTAECIVTVQIKPTVESTETKTVNFSTDYGLIDVIWLDTQNNVISEPNEPNLYSGDNALTPVIWSQSDGTWKEAQTNWYNYTPGTGTEDNTSSRWANAKNVDGSYFVWIPRYAYRITYYSDANDTSATGYYDGLGMWEKGTGNLSYKLDDGIETVTYNGDSYIVHPAFMKDDDKEGLEDYARGGWDSDLSGFWVAKFEMSRTGATATSEGTGYDTTFLSVPNVLSAINIHVGDMYEVALAYDRTKESHLIKNSEWGAVAYLTHSQYGRNGHEVSVNQSERITGAGRGIGANSIYNSTYKWSRIEESQKYTGEIGVLSSTTGNVYGVYDMSGGSYEYTASFCKKESFSSSEGAFNMTKNAKDEEGNYISTKYIMAYEGDGFSIIIYDLSKIGDGIKEVRASSSLTDWFGGTSAFPYSA